MDPTIANPKIHKKMKIKDKTVMKIMVINMIVMGINLLVGIVNYSILNNPYISGVSIILALIDIPFILIIDK